LFGHVHQPVLQITDGAAQSGRIGGAQGGADGGAIGGAQNLSGWSRSSRWAGVVAVS
jgi:hypothetical protein